MKTFNLESVVKTQGSTSALLIHNGYYDNARCYFDPGECYIDIVTNNLAGGYVGNTLLVPLTYRNRNKSNVLIEVDGLLFINCVLVLEINNIAYTLKKRYNYLRIKGIVKNDS